MELAVEQHCAWKTKIQTKMENVLHKNNRLLTQALSVEIGNIVVDDYRDIVSSPESAPTFAELFEINDLKAHVQEKDTMILKLKEKINSFSDDHKERKAKREVEEIETQNLELDHKEKVLVIIALKEQLNKLKGKVVLTEVVSLNPIDPALLQVVQIVLWVYYVEGLGHNLFSVGRLCDSDLEVAFRQHTCFIRNLEGVDLLTGSWGNNLYTLSLQDMMASFPICLLSKASKTKSWLWHRRLSYLNFGTINYLARQGLVRGLPKLKFEKDHLCSACAMGKSTKKTHKPKSEDTNQEKLYLLHMDLCGPMRVESVNGKKYILVIVDDYSRFTWVKFLCSKDETPMFIIKG
uniref:Retrovirus-related Pol polyprotein from transposon TNT 1-94 n=1 Tax=Tanacetum cinerariifolium TaxID=118510 RepID=A0A6L2LWD6_TANCI|nr:retrovirus-related Pol polyprotein from transposon TNT 1-94 [Tanacetum cinerariifolium]